MSPLSSSLTHPLQHCMFAYKELDNLVAGFEISMCYVLSYSKIACQKSPAGGKELI